MRVIFAAFAGKFCSEIPTDIFSNHNFVEFSTIQYCVLVILPNVMIAIIITVPLSSIISGRYALVEEVVFKNYTAEGRVITLLFAVCHLEHAF